MTDKELEDRKIELYNLLKKFIGYKTQDKEDLVHQIFEVFLRRKYIERFDPEKSSFKTFVSNYYKFILGNINMRTKYLNTVTLTEGFNDMDSNPSIDGIIVKKEILTEILDYFTDEELDLLYGDISGAELARRKGVTRQAVNIKLKDRIKKFKENQ